MVAFMIDFIVSEAKGWKAHKNRLKEEESNKGSDSENSNFDYIDFDKIKSRQESVSTKNGDNCGLNN